MKSKKFNFLGLLLLIGLFLITSCSKDDPKIEVVSGFSHKADENNFLKVTFTNASTNFTSLSWDFGDSGTSTEVNPVHVYAAAGTYTVKLTATASDGGTDVSSQVVDVVDLNADLTAIAGATSKTWKLLRIVSPGRWPLEVGPVDRSTVWWAMGKDNNEIPNRVCSMNDEFTFYRDGAYKLDDKGDFWVEGGWYAKPDNICAESTPANMKSPTGVDLSAFGSGTHQFTLGSQKLTLNGLGAWIGLFKVGTDVEVKEPKTSVTYNITKLSDGPIADTLILENDYKFNATDAAPGGYWKMVLVHYDNPADEPAIPDFLPAPGFTFVADVLKVDFTNTSKYATSYLWEFGDGMTSTAENPSHTYLSSGAYKVTLTATAASGSKNVVKEVTVSDGSFTMQDLVGGAWKIRPEANSIFVGPGLGNPTWWQVPVGFLTGSGVGVDDWSCITNDEFIFSADGTYEYKTNGDARNDGYFGSPNGCWTDAQVAASGNGAAFLSAKHTFTFTPATGTDRPIITVKNGSADRAGFIGFYKGYYGGENTDGTKAPNGGSETNRYEVISYIKDGGKELLTISVDYSAAKNGSQGWSAVLQR